MSKCNRASSPITMRREIEPGVKEKRRLYDLLLTSGKIHRVQLNAPALCEVVSVESPSCIWIRLENHIAENMRIQKPAHLEKLYVRPESIHEYDYVMAPLHEDTYARGRVLELRDGPHGLVRGRYAYVHFIDEGGGQWMNVDCLATIDSELTDTPWQAIPISLYKLAPGIDLYSSTPQDNWSPSQTALLDEILSEYASFRVVPRHDGRAGSGAVNTYAEYVRADLYGLKEAGDDEAKGESVAHRFAYGLESCGLRSKHCPETLLGTTAHLHRDLCDAARQSLLEPRDLPGERFDWVKLVENMPEWQLNFPRDFTAGLQLKPKREKAKRVYPNQKTHGDERPLEHSLEEMWLTDYEKDRVQPLSDAKVREAYAAWEPTYKVHGLYPALRRLSIAGLYESGYCTRDGWALVSVAWNSLRGPDHFYAFLIPLLNGGGEATSNQQLMRAALEERIEWKTRIDSFYSSPANQFRLTPEKVISSLRSGREAYAIHLCLNDDLTTGEFRRVQVLAFRDPHPNIYAGDQFCLVRYIDVGGSVAVPLASLFTLHSSHCQRIPLCLQLHYSSIRPVLNRDGSNGDGDGGSGAKWNQQARQTFKKLARSDVPYECQLAERQVPDIVTASYNGPARNWPGVMDVSSMRVRDTNHNQLRTTIETQMVESAAADIA